MELGHIRSGVLLAFGLGYLDDGGGVAGWRQIARGVNRKFAYLRWRDVWTGGVTGCGFLVKFWKISVKWRFGFQLGVGFVVDLQLVI